jgi:hypothetical protein
MNDTIPMRTRPMTALEVLARLTGFADESERSYIQPDAPIDDLALLWTDDLNFWTRRSRLRQLRRLIEEWFDICLDDWESEWLPPARRTVGELCERIAAAATVVIPEPVTVLGQPCLSAGTLLAVRTILANAGTDVSNVAPSTPLRPYVQSSPGQFRGRIALMAAGRIRVVISPAALRTDRRLLGLAALAVWAGLMLSVWTTVAIGAALLNGLSLGSVLAIILGVVGCLVCDACVRRCFASSRRLMRRLELPGLHDFRDVVDTILNRPPRRAAYSETPS